MEQISRVEVCVAANGYLLYTCHSNNQPVAYIAKTFEEVVEILKDLLSFKERPC